jgi:hypothetical protein
VAGFQFRGKFLLLQLKCDLLVGGNGTYSFRNARNREDAAQRLQSKQNFRPSSECTQASP